MRVEERETQRLRRLVAQDDGALDAALQAPAERRPVFAVRRGDRKAPGLNLVELAKRASEVGPHPASHPSVMRELGRGCREGPAI